MSSATPLQAISLEVIASVARVEHDQLGLDVDMFDLGLDSIDFWAILMDIEDRSSTEVPAEVFEALAKVDGSMTIGHLLELVARWESASDTSSSSQDEMSRRQRGPVVAQPVVDDPDVVAEAHQSCDAAPA